MDNPAQGLLDGYSKIMSKARGWLGDPDKPASSSKSTNADPDDVRKANDSFRKKLTSDGPTLGGKKKTAKKTRKASARKKE